MSRPLLLVLALALVGAALGAVVLVLGDDGTEAPGVAVTTRRGEGGGALDLQPPPSQARPLGGEVESLPARDVPPVVTPTPAAADPWEGGPPLALRLVRVADGSPLVGVRVTPRQVRTGRDAAPTAVTDVEGRVTFAEVAPDCAGVVIAQSSAPAPRDAGHDHEHDHGEGGRPTTLLADARAPLPDWWADSDDELEIEVDTGWIVGGRVVDLHGNAVEGVEVIVSGDPSRAGHTGQRGHALRATALTDAGGSFRVLDVPPMDGPRGDEYGYVPQEPWAVRLSAQARWHVPRSEVLTLDPGQRVAPPVVLTLAPAGEIVGRAGSRVAPMVGVTVEALLELRGDTIAAAPAGLVAESREPDGTFVISSVPAGRYLVSARPDELPAPHAGMTPEEGRHLMSSEAWYTDVIVEERRATELEVRLPISATAHGRVLDGGGRPLPGVPVSAVYRKVLYGFTPGERSILTVRGLEVVLEEGQALVTRTVSRETTDEHGSYSLMNLMEGEHLVAARPAGLARPLTAEVVVGQGETRQVPDLMPSLGLRVAGIVVEQGSEAPVIGARLAVVAAEGTVAVRAEDWVEVDRRGRFLLDGLDGTPVTLFVQAPGYAHARFEARPPEDDLVLRLAPAGVVSLRVTDGGGGTLSEVDVHLEGEVMLLTRTMRPDEDGVLRLDGLEPGTYQLTLSAPGHESTTVELTVGGQPFEQALVVPRQ